MLSERELAVDFSTLKICNKTFFQVPIICEVNIVAFNLQNVVGLNDDGSFAPNRALDQQQVAELLMMIPLPFGGLKSSMGSLIEFPQPFVDGAISAELVGAIQTFQTVQIASLSVDLRVEPGGFTWQLMLQLATQDPVPTDLLATIVLDPIGQFVEEAPPAPVLGLPAIVYKLAETEQLVFDNGAMRATMSFSGLLSGLWGSSFGLACLVNPSFLTLDQAVKSGDARRIGATALDQACNELRAQTRLAANGLFAAVSMSVDLQGTFRVSGSLGDGWHQLSVGFVFPNTITATGSITISESVPLTTVGGNVKFDGTLACTIKIMFRDQVFPDEASILANLVAVVIAGRIVLVPLASWISEAVTISTAQELVRRAAPGLAREIILLGPSPAVQ
jgi:hypothetical protein